MNTAIILSALAANDNAPVCESGCGRAALTWDHLLCAECTAEMNAHIDAGEPFASFDDEGVCLAGGFEVGDDQRYL